jgi:RNA polymerase sigma-70 factor (ECF subfamily)
MLATGSRGEGSTTRTSRLSELLRSRWHARDLEPEAASDELDVMLLDIIGSAQRTCPTFRLPPDVFVAYLGERLPPDVPWPLALRQMHTSDLYIACGCARGDVHAFAVFDDRCLTRLDRVLGKMGIDADMAAEIKQDIRSRVLVGDGRHAEIRDFSGRGDLCGWVCVMAVRRALRHKSRARREVRLEDDELVQRIVTPGNPELDHAKGLYRQEFKQAFEGALRALPDRQRTLLRQAYVDGLTIDELAGLYRVHRSTAARLLVRARLLVLETTRARMMSRLDVPPQDLDSIMRMIRSQIEISLAGLRGGRKR